MRVAVVGTGPAAAATIHKVLQLAPEASITVFDPCEEAEAPPRVDPTDRTAVEDFYSGVYREIKATNGLHFPPVKTRFGKPGVRVDVDGKARCFTSDLHGGLSTYWSGVMVPFKGDDFKAWPIDEKDLAPYYREVTDLVGISGADDQLERILPRGCFNRPPIRVPKGLDLLRSQIEGRRARGDFDVACGVARIAMETRADEENRCIECGECSAGCVLGSIWSTTNLFAGWLRKERIGLCRERVTRVGEDGWVETESASGIERRSGFDRVFLGAGCLGTTEIVMRSTDTRSGPIMVDNAIFQFPVVNVGWDSSDEERVRHVGMTNLVMHCDPRTASARSAQLQLVPNIDYLWRNALPESIWPRVREPLLLLRDRLLWSRLYIHSDFSYQYRISLNGSGSLRLEEAKKPDQSVLGEIIRSLKSVIDSRRFFLPPGPRVPASTSNHLGGTLPYGRDTTREGKVLEGVYICDSACFPDSPATSPTLTIMANACRTVEAALA